MRIVCVSDTHCQLDRVIVPEGDVLLHAGDLTYTGSIKQMAHELYVLGQLRKRFRAVAFICGNHDWLGEKDPTVLRCMAEDYGLTWLQDEVVEVEGISIYGSAWTLEFYNWAFNMDRHDGTPERIWGKIPDDTDVLLTHGPSYGNLDDHPAGRLGCAALSRAVDRVRPKLHVFGHIHHSYGRKVGADGVTYVNASACDESYSPVNPPIVVDWPMREGVDGQG